MKKLSLILAFVLVFALVLVACGDETETSSTPATESSVAATESSAAATEESSEAAVEESSEAAVEESSEAAVEESSEAEESTEAPVAGTENLAAGKTYTFSEQFRQGGAEVNWGWSDTAPYAYPDEDGKTMTDGVIANSDSVYSDAVWAGWTGVHPTYSETGYAWITVDLGEATDIARAVVQLGSSGLDNGIGATNMVIEIAVSTDGETFEVVGGTVPEDDASTCCIETVIDLDAAANAQYVQFRLNRTGWMFISEVEVYGVAE